MAGKSSEPTQEQLDRIPSGYLTEPTGERWCLRCLDCGHRWYADRMTHTANVVFLLDHRWEHTRKRRGGMTCQHVNGLWDINGDRRCWTCGATSGPSTATL